MMRFRSNADVLTFDSAIDVFEAIVETIVITVVEIVVAFEDKVSFNTATSI